MEIDWKSVEKILVVRLRSIGDTVLTTPTLIALREFLPNARIDVLLEDWVAPVLEGFPAADEILTVKNSGGDRTRVALNIRKRKYDVAVNLHGGTSAGFLTRASGARHRIGYRGYQYAFLYNKKYPSPSEFWNRTITHSAENQIALLGFAGVPVKPCPKTSLTVTDEARSRIVSRLNTSGVDVEGSSFALIHPGAAYDTKRWSAEKYASVVKYLENRGMSPVVVFTDAEARIVRQIESALGRGVNKCSGLSLPEVTALASISSLFVGNDS
ncbi:MAG: glycosyltransferase family 9 protein, partial [Acidobacteriota bacterium]|nr:glycosyltransferase family 9 protein [Acidobacteriota bacterium]